MSRTVYDSSRAISESRSYTIRTDNWRSRKARGIEVVTQFRPHSSLRFQQHVDVTKPGSWRIARAAGQLVWRRNRNDTVRYGSHHCKYKFHQHLRHQRGSRTAKSCLFVESTREERLSSVETGWLLQCLLLYNSASYRCGWYRNGFWR